MTMKNTTTLENKNKVASLYHSIVLAIRLSNNSEVLNQPIAIADAKSFAESGINVKGLKLNEALNVVKNWLKSTQIA